MKYAVNSEGVQALKSLSMSIVESAAAVGNAADALASIADKHSSTLGPHYTTISNIIDEIKAAEGAATEPVSSISEMLADVAEAYNEIIEADPFSGFSGNGIAGAGAVAAGAFAGAMAGSNGQNDKGLLGALGKVLSAASGKDSAVGSEGISSEAAELQRMGVNRVDLSGCSAKNRQAVLSAVKSMFAAHPELRGQLSEIICKPMSGRTYAAYGPTAYGSPFGGSLKLNSNYFSNEDLAADLAEKSRLGWFVPNATPASIVMHELGHGLHLEMCALDCGVMNGSTPSYDDYVKVVNQYMDDVHAEEIVEEACEAVGVEFDSWDFSGQLSKYGGSNYGEAIAEAVAEVKSNSAPRALATAIYNGIISRTTKLRGGK